MIVRTIDTEFDEILKDDPNTAITRRGLRRAVTEGYIPSVRSGKKYLVTHENVLAYYSGLEKGCE